MSKPEVTREEYESLLTKLGKLEVELRHVEKVLKAPTKQVAL